MLRFVLVVIAISFVCHMIVFVNPIDYHNISNWRSHRHKRFLIYQNAGTAKFITGITYPVDLGDKKNWRQLVLTMNIQYQFGLPTMPIYWPTNWQYRAFSNSAGKIRIKTDNTAKVIYKLLEVYMNGKGMNGSECLLRSICENALVQKKIGMFGQIISRILTPPKSPVNRYTEAYSLGRKGVNCRLQYGNLQECAFDSIFKTKTEINYAMK